MLTVNVITLFPEIFSQYSQLLPLRRALDIGELKINVTNLRDYGLDERLTVDDKIYGGGTGMLLRIEPVVDALEALKVKKGDAGSKIIFLTPAGQKLTQKMVGEYSKLNTITFVCGRYEGIDARIDHFIDEKLSIGDYVLAGGELPTLVVLESITRLLPNVLSEEAVSLDSFYNDWIEYPQYTRPEEFRGYSVPKVLLTGDHEKIKQWRKENMQEIKN